MNLNQLILAMVFGLSMAGCSSTDKNTNNNAALKHNNERVVDHAKTAYQFNKIVEEAMVKGDAKTLLSLVDFSLAHQQLPLPMHQSTQKIVAEPTFKANLNKKLTNLLVSVRLVGDVSYRYSDNHNGCCWVSHYQILGDEEMVDIDLYIDKNSKTIFDIHEKAFEYSSLQTVTKALDKLAQLHDNEDRGAAFVFNKYLLAIKAYQVGNVSHTKAIEVFNALPDKLKSDILVAELLIRTMAVMENDAEKRAQVFKAVAVYHPMQIWLENYYFNNDAIDKALGVIKQSSEAVTQTYVMQGEIMALYSKLGNTEQALKYAMNVVYSDPENPVSYILVLMATLNGDKHQLTSQVLDVMQARYTLSFSKDWLKSIGDADNYIASEDFAQWQAKHNLL